MAGGWPHRRMSTERAYESYLEHRDPEVNQVMESEDQENSSSLAIVKEIAALHGGEVFICPKGKVYTLVTIVSPGQRRLKWVFIDPCEFAKIKPLQPTSYLNAGNMVNPPV